MVATVDLICEASHKHAGEVTALCFDGEHLYSGSSDGVINVRNPKSESKNQLFLIVNCHKLATL